MSQDTKIVGYVALKDMVELLRETGMVSIDETGYESGRPVIRASLKVTNARTGEDLPGGLPFAVILFKSAGEPGCSNMAVASIVPHAALHIALPDDFFNRCNQYYRFVRVYPLDANMFIMQMDLYLHGATREYVKYAFGLWAATFTQILFELLTHTPEQRPAVPNLGEPQPDMPAVVAADEVPLDLSLAEIEEPSAPLAEELPLEAAAPELAAEPPFEVAPEAELPAQVEVPAPAELPPEPVLEPAVAELPKAAEVGPEPVAAKPEPRPAEPEAAVPAAEPAHAGKAEPLIAPKAAAPEKHQPPKAPEAVPPKAAPEPAPPAAAAVAPAPKASPPPKAGPAPAEPMAVSQLDALRSLVRNAMRSAPDPKQKVPPKSAANGRKPPPSPPRDLRAPEAKKEPSFAAPDTRSKPANPPAR